MKLKAIDRKILREAWQMRGQVITIALVVACGMAVFVTSLGTLHSLRNAQRAYYDRYRFADVFGQLKRAPRSLESQVRALPGVGEVQTRVVIDVSIDIEGQTDPITGRLISLPPDGAPPLNRLFLRNGRMLDPRHPEEVLVGEAFASAHRLKPGDAVKAVINGRQQELRIVGLVLSPEYVFALRAGDIVPDDKRFGVFWIGEEALANAMNMAGAFNDIAIKLSPGTGSAPVIGQLDQLLAPYGGGGAYDRHEHASSRNVSDELDQLQTLATVAPAIFLGVAAFLLNVVLSRLIGTQRSVIAALKALGYMNREIGLHYMKLVLLVVLIGAVLGVSLGSWMGGTLTVFYGQTYRFPVLAFRLDVWVVVLALFISLSAALLGALSAVRRAVNLPPAEAMRPEAPKSFKKTLVERVGLQGLLSQRLRMILRQLERQWLRTLMATMGIAFAVAIVMVGSYFRDAIDGLVDVQFRAIQREDLTVVFNEPLSADVLREIEHLPGVTYAEPVRGVPVRLVSGHYSRRTAIQGLRAGAQLRRFLGADGRPRSLPPEGLVLTRELAEALRVQPGSRLTVEVLEGERRVRELVVTGLVEELVGVSAYMDIQSLGQLLGGSQTVSSVLLSMDSQGSQELLARLKEFPAIGSVGSREAMLRLFRAGVGERIVGFSVILAAFASVIAIGVVYNSARIALAERAFELGCLRVMGFTRKEVSILLLSELGIQVFLAIPIGFGLGRLMVEGMAKGMASEFFRLPTVLSMRTYALATIVITISGLISGLIVRRKLDHLDLIGVLKNRE